MDHAEVLRRLGAAAQEGRPLPRQVLVAGGQFKNLRDKIRRVMSGDKIRVEFWTEDQADGNMELPVGTQLVLYTRWLSHKQMQKIRAQTEPNCKIIGPCGTGSIRRILLGLGAMAGATPTAAPAVPPEEGASEASEQQQERTAEVMTQHTNGKRQQQTRGKGEVLEKVRESVDWTAPSQRQEAIRLGKLLGISMHSCESALRRLRRNMGVVGSKKGDRGGMARAAAVAGMKAAAPTPAPAQAAAVSPKANASGASGVGTRAALEQALEGLKVLEEVRGFLELALAEIRKILGE